MNKPIFIAGPCLAESESVINETASELSRIFDKLEVDFYFKASYRKANRSSINSFSGIGDQNALELIASAANKFRLRTLTDIHLPEEADLAAKYVDVLQIPAFLARQTDLLTAAGKTQKTVNIKKGQFMAPEDMAKAIRKVESTGNKSIMVTERGTSFGYHDLVVDFRGITIMKESRYPVIYDATHSVQLPAIGEQSGGRPEFIEKLALASIAAGADGIFFETHPDPKIAMSDSATQLPLKDVEKFIHKLHKLFTFVNNL